MKRVCASLAGLAIAALALTSGLGRTPAAAASDTRLDTMQFQTMFGNHAPFIGATGAVRGVTAAPLPWMVGAVHGTLFKDGELVIDVDGLVLADEPSVPAGLRGTNPVPSFSAVVSCLTATNGAVATVNVVTANVPATMPGGDAHIDQRLALPHPCVAPAVLVTAPSGAAWFAASGG
jgi:hypothetical protein